MHPSMEADQRVQEWVDGLPSADEITPLSQPLISPEIAAAFGVSPEPQRSLIDVHSASQETLEALRLGKPPPLAPEKKEDDGEAADAATESTEKDAEDAAEDGPSGRAAKRPRLLWTPHLHGRFVEVVAHLGVKKAVPKAIMQLMNVEGLTRENVASHLQKYRLYLKRVSGEEEAAEEENSTSTAPSSNAGAGPTVTPVLGGGGGGGGGGGSIGMVRGPVGGGHYPWFVVAHPPFAAYGQPVEWPIGNTIRSNSLAQYVCQIA